MRTALLLLLCSLMTASEDLGTLLSRARTARDAGQYEAALTAYGAMLDQVPDHETALLERSQTLAWAGRYGEALEGLRTFKARYPQRALDADLRTAQVLAWSGAYDPALELLEPWLRREDRQATLDSATYLAWSGRLDQGLERLEDWLQRHPGDLRASLDRARYLGWAGRLEAAYEAYTAILHVEPKEASARLGLAQVALWQGRPDSADAHWESLDDEGRRSPEAQLLKARIEIAMGRPREARARLEALPAGGQASREADELRVELTETQGPWQTLTHTRTDTSEGLRTEEKGLRLRFPLFEGSVDLGGSRYAASFQGVDATSNRLDLRMAQPVGSRLRLGAGLEHWSDFGGKASTGHALSLGLRAAPELDLRLGWTRTLFTYTPTAMRRRGAISTVEAGAAWTFGDGKDTVEGAIARGTTTAGTTRRSQLVSYQHRFTTSVGALSLGGLYRRFGYSSTEALGFFNPEDYRWWGMTAGYTYRLGRRFSFGVDARSGWQNVDHGERNATWAYTASLQWTPAGGPWSLSASWSDMRAGLPVTDPSDLHHYGEHTLTFGVKHLNLRKR